MRTVRAISAVVLLAVAAYTVAATVRTGESFSAVWDLALYGGPLIGVAAACAARAVLVAQDRAAWGVIAVGLACYASGALVYAELSSSPDPVPYPSVADALWLSLYPAALVAIGLMVRGRLAGSSASMWLDGIVSGLGLASLSAVLVFPRVTAGASGDTAAIVTNFAYPLLDLALVAVVVGAMAALGAWRELPWVVLGVGFLVFAGADSWFLLQIADETYLPAGAVDVLYLFAAGLIAVAASLPPSADTRDEAAGQSRSFLVPGAFAFVALVVLASGARADATALGIGLAVGALLAAWVRTSLAVREVVRLSDSRRQALTDPLTGLPNRRAFYEILEHTTGRTAGATSALILADVDGFKEINDALGHQLGDQLLRALAHRFAAQVPTGATVARLGGDEVAVLVPQSEVEHATALAQRLIDSLGEPFVVRDTSLHLSASLGIALVGSGDEVSRVLSKADLAMYRAKSAHSGWEVYDDERDGDAWDRFATVEALRETLAGGEGLLLEFQPIVVAAGLAPTGMEALLRWHHPVRGRVAPDAFLPLAERAGLMPLITRAVLDLSMQEAMSLRQNGWTVPVSVNLSASDLLDGHLVEYVADGLARHGLPAEALRLEITESLLVDSGSDAVTMLHQLRELGMAIAVDDYGTGYSCLAYLHDLPVSHLKIDRAFTGRLLEDDRTDVIVASTIAMAHGLDLAVVAEGVETVDQLQWLVAHGCDFVQGYHVARPMPAAALHDWLAERVSVSSAAAQ